MFTWLVVINSRLIFKSFAHMPLTNDYLAPMPFPTNLWPRKSPLKPRLLESTSWSISYERKKTLIICLNVIFIWEEDDFHRLTSSWYKKKAALHFIIYWWGIEAQDIPKIKTVSCPKLHCIYGKARFRIRDGLFSKRLIFLLSFPIKPARELLLHITKQ